MVTTVSVDYIQTNSGGFPDNRFYSLIQSQLGQPVTGWKKNAWYVVSDGLRPSAFSDANLIHSPPIMIRRHDDPVLTPRSPGFQLVFLFLVVCSCARLCVHRCAFVTVSSGVTRLVCLVGNCRGYMCGASLNLSEVLCTFAFV